MKKIRTLVVDDSVVARQIISKILKDDPFIEVVGVAANGRIALQKIPQVKPDVITLDVDMPQLNGIETLREVRKLYPDLPVIMFSTIGEHGAYATLEALALGACDFVTKPQQAGGSDAALECIKEDLVPKVYHFGGKRLGVELSPCTAVGRSVSERSTGPGYTGSFHKATSLRALVIGVSTGGPEALAKVIPRLPVDIGVPVFIVQHMPPVFTHKLAQRLDSKSGLKVVEAQAGMIVEAGTVYLAPGGYHMVVTGSANGVIIDTHKGEKENSCRPAADVLFRSAGEVYGGSLLAVVLTGMGTDGLRGCENLAEKGARIFVQDEASSVVWGMPGFVARANLAEKQIPIEELGLEIIQALKTNAP
jgi:two-component system chemotaxis response regulator CheB